MPAGSSQDELDRHWLKEAIRTAHLSEPSPSAYCVGAILVLHGPTPPNSISQQAIDLLKQQHANLSADLSDAVVLATGFSRELPGNTHAEEACLMKLNKLLLDLRSTAGLDSVQNSSAVGGSIDAEWSLELKELVSQAGITMYTTMEPCSKRLSGRPPCVNHLLQLNIPRVVMGIAEPQDIFVQCTGIKSLQDQGIIVKVISGLEEDCWRPNAHIRLSYFG
jgi:pyrimidine deaminase RibD-like protein